MEDGKQIITAEILPTEAQDQSNVPEAVSLEPATQSSNTANDNNSASNRNGRDSHGVEGGDEPDDDLIGDLGFGDRSMRDGRPHKYPALKQYYEFGAWVGRNRKAICVSCRHQSASSQPERLIRHLKRCPALSEHDRSIADDLLAETMANKKTPGRPPGSGYRNHKNANRSYNDDSYNSLADQGDEDCANNNDTTNETGTPAAVGLRPTIKRQKVYAETRNRIDEALTRFIMVNRIPLKSISSKEFVEFVKALNPDYRIPHQNTITNVLIPGLLQLI